MKHTLYFILALSLFACQSHDSNQTEISTASPGTDTMTDTATTAEPAKPVVPDSAYLIVPGQRVGQVELGMPAAVVNNILGKADSGDAAMGKALSFWVSKTGNGPREYVAVYTVNDFDGSGDGPKVDQVQVTSPQFKTIDGTGTGDALSQIRKQFSHLRPLAYYTNQKNQQVYIYDDQPQGIAFEITVADSLCTAITVHRQGTDVTDTYLPVHPDMTRLEHQ
ncbi:hypothetical protein I2I11_17955 [Pontibacter sp. 172403-2]|uniref:hypothetical protein n=1 Tax=Pontibacter rufus TaxID=2791028 RepID=UPI0018B01073|nr:hypothetical protein [Pontibacter sp. 172403-2]MBF9255187.1 hypothetical protein [Pontibacter sp. 172403-2]